MSLQPSTEEQYLQHLIERLAALPIRELAPHNASFSRTNFEVDKCCVQLDLVRWQDQAPAKISSTDWADPERGTAPTSRVHLFDAIRNHPFSLVVGPVGSGKSVFLRYLAVMLAKKHMFGPESVLDLDRKWASTMQIPLWISLRRLGQHLHLGQISAEGSALIWEYLGIALRKPALEHLVPILKEKADDTRFVFLMDGLDAVPRELTERVYATIVGLTTDYGGPSQVLVSSRPFAQLDELYSKFSIKPSVFLSAPLDSDQAWHIARRLYAEMPNHALSEAEFQQKLAAIETDHLPANLSFLTRSPLFLALTVACLLDRNLPGTQGLNLIEESIGLLLERWHSLRDTDNDPEDPLLSRVLDSARARTVLEQLAYDLQSQRQTAPAATASDEQLRVKLQQNQVPDDRVGASVAELELNGILTSKVGLNGDGRYGFIQRTFESYLAGCQLAKIVASRAVDSALVLNAPDHWTPSFVTACHQLPKEGLRLCTEMINALMTADLIAMPGLPPDWTLCNWARVGKALVEISSLPDVPMGCGETKRKVAAQLATLLRQPAHSDLLLRKEAAEVLGLLGYPDLAVRTGDKGVQFIAPDFVRIPAGRCLIGSRPTHPGAWPDEFSVATGFQPHWVELPDFWISRYPVTHREYYLFVQATGWPAPGCWVAGRPANDFHLHPVNDLNWDDARAYCDWLGDLLGVTIRIPSEVEWEKAASWNPLATKANIYPWGDHWDASACNTVEGDIRSTTPVILYPSGASPLGIFDLAGNVWEWTCSLVRDYPYARLDGRERLTSDPRRIVKGGSFKDGREYTRCSTRCVNGADLFEGNLGLRVACDSAPKLAAAAQDQSSAADGQDEMDRIGK